MQDFILFIAHEICRAYIRHAPLGIAQQFVWNRICRRHLNWREFGAVKKTRFGSRIACNVDDMIQAHIYYFGQWEPNLTAFLERRLKCGDTFIDVGANIGYFSLLASSLVGPKGRVVAIEASPSIYGQLAENIERNFAENIRPVCIAASDRRETVDLFRGAIGNQGATSLSQGSGMPKEATIRTAPFDEILEGSELSRARVIKIDIEGAERPVLDRILSRIRDFRYDVEIVVELAIAPTHKGSSSSERLIKEFEEAGFFCYRLTNEFSIPRYLGQVATLPAQRLAVAPSEIADLVFSRENAEYV